MKKVLLAACLAAGSLAAAENTVMHCFAFTPIKEAAQSDWDAFYKATDALPTTVPGVKRVWYGKLARPLAQFSIADAEARKKVTAEGKGQAEVSGLRREHGVCMEFADEAAFKAYGPHEGHKAWTAAYEKVRVPGTTTFQILPVQK